MKLVLLSSALAALSFTAALPQYGPPPGGWDNVKYPTGTGANLPYYPPPPGGWESVKYPPGTGGSPPKSVFTFTSEYYVKATGKEVLNGTTPTPGPDDAVGFYYLGINAPEDTICWNITFINVKGPYMSPARTATHIHQAARGASGPPRVVFPNPVGDDRLRRSLGCMTGPFETGVKAADGADTGAGFKLAQIEANPAGFFADAHTRAFTAGVVRGQLQ